MKKNDKISFPPLAFCIIVFSHPGALISEAMLVSKDSGNGLGRDSWKDCSVQGVVAVTGGGNEVVDGVDGTGDEGRV